MNQLAVGVFLVATLLCGPSLAVAEAGPPDPTAAQFKLNKRLYGAELQTYLASPQTWSRIASAVNAFFKTSHTGPQIKKAVSERAEDDADDLERDEDRQGYRTDDPGRYDGFGSREDWIDFRMWELSQPDFGKVGTPDSYIGLYNEVESRLSRQRR